MDINLRILTYVVLFIVSIIGFIAFVIGNNRKINTLTSLGILCVLFALWSTIELVPGFGLKISAFATVGVTLLAVATITENRRLQKENRKDDLAREGRERRERLLNEIREWTNHFSHVVSTIMSQPAVGIDNIGTAGSIGIDNILLEQITELKHENMNIRYFTSIAREISLDLEKAISSLEPIVSNLVQELYDTGKLINELKKIQYQDQILAQNSAINEKFSSNHVLVNDLASKIELISQNVAQAKLDLLKE